MSDSGAILNAQFHGGRLLLPRQEPPPPPPQVTKRTRATKACTSCRNRKTKCTGELPRCFECKTCDLDCAYEQGRRDRLKDVLEHKRLLVALLKDLRQNVYADQRKMIEDALDAVDEDYPHLPPPISLEAVYQQPATDTSANQTFGLPTHLQINSSDTVKSARTHQNLDAPPPHETATGQWLPSLHNNPAVLGEQGYVAPSDMVEGSSNEFCPDSSFYLYDHNVEVDDEVDVHQFPSFELASKLLQQYLGQVHGWLPMIPQDFEGQVRRYYEESQMVPAEWLAMLNLVFAIGSRHYYLINTQRQAGENQRHEHALYMSRAIQLLRSRSADLLTTSPNLPLVQAFGLLSFYQLAVGYVERAWVTIGLALRVGIALGMHLKNKENSSLPDKTDELSRVWWSLLSLQTFLCSVTGRPSAIPQYEINTPFPRLPAEYREGRSEIALQLNFKISVVAQWAMSSLYSVRAATLPWPSIQKQVVKLKSELEKLLPAISDRERLILHFSWFDSMILITRPCLGRRNDNAGPSSIEAHKVAAECIQAAQGVTRLLPDEPSERIFQNGPWWCLSLYIMRAMAVLLLAQAHQSSTSTNDDMSLNMSTKKLILWLRWMRPMDPVADRGLNAVLNTLRRSQNHANFADVFEQESADAYGGYLLVPGRWEVDTSAVYPQLHPEFEGFDDPDFLDSVLSLSSLPMPPVYGSAFAVVDSSWDW